MEKMTFHHQLLALKMSLNIEAPKSINPTTHGKTHHVFSTTNSLEFTSAGDQIIIMLLLVCVFSHTITQALTD